MISHLVLGFLGVKCRCFRCSRAKWDAQRRRRSGLCVASASRFGIQIPNPRVKHDAIAKADGGRSMRRREFLKTGAASAMSLPVAAQLFTPARTPPPGIIDIGGRKQLFLDDLLIAEASRISKFMGRVR